MMPDSIDTPLWISASTIDIPEVDILSFTFANFGHFDKGRPIFSDAKNPYDFVSVEDSYHLIRKVIKGFTQLGLEEGDNVYLHMSNSIWYPILWLGVIGAGGCVAGNNPANTAAELVRYFDLLRPKFIIADVKTIDTVSVAASQFDIPRNRIFFIGTGDNLLEDDCQSWRILLKHGESDWQLSRDPDSKFSEERIAAYAMTSGTTGPPKAAMISHRYVVAQIRLLEAHFSGRNYEPSQLICLPLFHAFASALAIVLPLRLGIKTYFLPRFNLTDFTLAVQVLGITDTPIVPPIVAQLNRMELSERCRLQTLRYIICAGASIPSQVQSQLYESLSPKAIISQCWGTTETGWITLFPCQERDTSGSVGRILSNVQLKVVDNDGIAGGEGKVGEGLIRTPVLFSGYLNNSEATSAAFDAQGYYRTGDRIYLQDDKIFHVGRIKETMKVKGWQVSPEEMEDVLTRHPKILDAAVVGVTELDEAGIPQTLIQAYVVRSAPRRTEACQEPGENTELGIEQLLTEQEVKDFVATRVISYKRLTGAIIFVKAIPRSVSGKILRRFLGDTELDA